MERNADAPQVLRPGGWLVIALGFGSRDYVANLLSGRPDVRIDPDLAAVPRGPRGYVAPSCHLRQKGTAVE